MTKDSEPSGRVITFEEWQSLTKFAIFGVRHDTIECYEKFLEVAPFLSHNVLRFKPATQSVIFKELTYGRYVLTERIYALLDKLEKSGKYKAQWFNNSISLSLSVVWSTSKDGPDYSFVKLSSDFIAYVRTWSENYSSDSKHIPDLLGLLYGFDRTQEVMKLWVETDSGSDLPAFISVVENWDELKDYPLSWAINMVSV